VIGAEQKTLSGGSHFADKGNELWQSLPKKKLNQKKKEF
jgi:hypothetical protein